MQYSEGKRKVARLCFWVYLFLLVYYLLFAERNYLAKSYNIVPFSEIARFIRYRGNLGFKAVLENIGGNIAGFLPFGYLLPVMTSVFRKGIRVFFCCFLFSLCIELSQLLLQLGCFDVDDVILNTAGGVLGYSIYLCTDAIRRMRSGTKKKKTS